jgi:glycosyltransferase involved in cell wall biosynthesis
VEYFRNRYAGQRCFIIGNGPSLNKVDLKKLKDEFTFGVNSIFLARDKMGFEPTFYCVEDTHVAKDRQREIQNINSPVKVFGHYLNKVILPHPHNLFLNILLDYRRYTGFPYFSVDASRRLWVGGSVSYVNMQLAYYMGFDQVYLIGFDHEYTIPDSAIVKGADIHSTTEDPNHFHPDYFGKGYNWHVPLVNRMELGYLKARRAFALDGREIVNLTPGGHLEVFRRGDYDAVVDARPDSARGPEDVRLKDREVKISVVVPSYNVESCLMDTLDSIQAQSFLDFEIIIVNDGSTDSTLQVAQDYADRFPNTRVISQENRGLGGARNTGLRESRGRYCTFVDSDDLIMPDMLLELYSEAERSGAEIVQCGYERRQNGKTLKTVKASVDMTGFSTLVHMATGHSFSAWAKLYRIDFLREHDLHFEDHVYHEDIEFTLKAHHFATKARTVPYIGYVWMVRDGSITSKVKEKHIVDISHILRKIKAFYVQEKLYDRLHRRYYSLCYRLFLIVLERIYGEKDLWERTLLLRTFRRELEAHDLDFYEYIWEANSSYKNTLEVIKKAYQLDMCFEKQPGKDQAKAAAPSAAPSAVRGPAPEKPFRRIRKLFRDPYKFFNDSKSPLKGLRVLFLPEK